MASDCARGRCLCCSGRFPREQSLQEQPSRFPWTGSGYFGLSTRMPGGWSNKSRVAQGLNRVWMSQRAHLESVTPHRIAHRQFHDAMEPSCSALPQNVRVSPTQAIVDLRGNTSSSASTLGNVRGDTSSAVSPLGHLRGNTSSSAVTLGRLSKHSEGIPLAFPHEMRMAPPSPAQRLLRSASALCIGRPQRVASPMRSVTNVRVRTPISEPFHAEIEKWGGSRTIVQLRG